jgi:hypothetical protein
LCLHRIDQESAKVPVATGTRVAVDQMRHVMLLAASFQASRCLRRLERKQLSADLGGGVRRKSLQLGTSAAGPRKPYPSALRAALNCRLHGSQDKGSRLRKLGN